MEIFRTIIETFALTTVGWLAAEFIRYSWNRGSGRQTASVPAAEPQQPIAKPQPPQITDSILPFRRPTPKPTDRDLIRFAKSINYVGSKKWCFPRKLSGEVPSELLQLWNEHQRLKAAWSNTDLDRSHSVMENQPTALSQYINRLRSVGVELEKLMILEDPIDTVVHVFVADISTADDVFKERHKLKELGRHLTVHYRCLGELREYASTLNDYLYEAIHGKSNS